MVSSGTGGYTTSQAHKSQVVRKGQGHKNMASETLFGMKGKKFSQLSMYLSHSVTGNTGIQQNANDLCSRKIPSWASLENNGLNKIKQLGFLNL